MKFYYSITSKIRRYSCLFFYYAVAIWFPTQPMPGYRLGYALRRFLIRRFIVKCGRDVVVKQFCYIGSGEGLQVGDRSQLGHRARIDQHVTIGDDVVMGPDVIIMTNSHAFESPLVPINRQGNLPVRPVVIGNDVWIGTRVIILPGVKVGDKAILGAGAVVTRDVSPLTIVGGNPARVIRIRGDKLKNLDY